MISLQRNEWITVFHYTLNSDIYTPLPTPDCSELGKVSTLSREELLLRYGTSVDIMIQRGKTDYQ